MNYFFQLLAWLHSLCGNFKLGCWRMLKSFTDRSGTFVNINITGVEVALSSYFLSFFTLFTLKPTVGPSGGPSVGRKDHRNWTTEHDCTWRRLDVMITFDLMEMEKCGFGHCKHKGVSKSLTKMAEVQAPDFIDTPKILRCCNKQEKSISLHSPELKYQLTCPVCYSEYIISFVFLRINCHIYLKRLQCL